MQSASGVEIEDTYSELFGMWATRILITAQDIQWASIAARSATGYATSVIGSPAESGVECKVQAKDTPDNRPGVVIQIYHTSRSQLKAQMLSRISQCILTCPTTAVFDALTSSPRRARIGAGLRYFGDGYEKKEEINGRMVWTLPVMEGRFSAEETFGVRRAVAGGNLLLMASTQLQAIQAAKEAISASKKVPGVIAPFPGGVCRAGSKIGSVHYKLPASTYTQYCPSIREDIPDTKVPEGVESIYELVFNGLNLERVKMAMKEGLGAAADSSGIVKITAANYGGRLGPYKVFLKELLQ